MAFDVFEKWFYLSTSKEKDGDQDELGQLDDITPFGRAFLKADTYPAVQEMLFKGTKC
jgi:hypothetical protein